jgi:hypothetical protein
LHLKDTRGYRRLGQTHVSPCVRKTEARLPVFLFAKRAKAEFGEAPEGIHAAVYTRVGDALSPSHRHAVKHFVVKSRVQREITCVHWVGHHGPVNGRRELLHIGEVGRVACRRTSRLEELGLDGGRSADSVFPSARQSLHRGKNVPQRQACDYGLEKLRRVEDGFARGCGVWSVGGVMLRGGDLAGGLALLLDMSVLRTFKRLRWMTDFGRALVISVRRVCFRRARHKPRAAVQAKPK